MQEELLKRRIGVGELLVCPDHNWDSQRSMSRYQRMEPRHSLSTQISSQTCSSRSPCVAGLCCQSVGVQLLRRSRVAEVRKLTLVKVEEFKRASRE